MKIYPEIKRLLNNKQLNIRYFMYYLKSYHFKEQLRKHITGSAQLNYGPSHLKKMIMPIVHMSEQLELIEKLDRIQSIIDKRHKELKCLDNLIKSRFIDMFGTLEKPTQRFPKDILKNLCNKITDGKHGGCTAEIGTGRYFIGAREIYNDEIHYDKAPEINVDEFEKDYKRCNFEIGDFVIVNTGATIGKSAIATDNRATRTLLQKSVALLKVKKELLNPVFLKWCYRVNEKMYKVDTASAQANLLLSKINSTEIFVPEIGLQNQFSEFVDQIDKLKSEVQKSLDETQLLMDSLMQKYFG